MRALIKSTGSVYLMMFGQKAFIVRNFFGLGSRQTEARNLRTVQTYGSSGIAELQQNNFNKNIKGAPVNIQGFIWLFLGFCDIVVFIIMSAKATLSRQQKQIIGQVNELLFQNFRQFKKSLYSSLMKCAININNLDLYYECTEKILQKEASAQKRLKTQLQTYQKQYRSKIAQCKQLDKTCLSDCHQDLRQNMYRIFNTFYGESMK